MYSNIVVGYDGSDEADDALALARVLRADDGAVMAASVSEDDRRPPHPGEPAGWLRSLSLTAASPRDGLLGLVERTGADLLVVGSSGRAEPGRTLAGPVGHRLVNGSPCPVAVAPRGFLSGAIRPRLVTIGFEVVDEVADALGEGVSLARSLGAGVRLLCVVPPLPHWALEAASDAGYRRSDVERDHLSGCRHMLDEASAAIEDPHAEALMLEGRLADVLAGRTEAAGDILVLACRGPGSRLRLSTTALDVLRSAPCPVLLTPGRESDIRSDGASGESPERRSASRR
ncbi:MAG TPA: universal stress protein [Thermoleophilaceae bacterium]|nr:universal stress protein [Thermoleophilaceae bacterium]